MKIVFLDAYSVGDSDLSSIAALGDLTYYPQTLPHQTVERCRDAQVVITNKVRLDEPELTQLIQTRLICVAATGTNNIDLEAARRLGIEVRNAVDYSSVSVAQHTFAMLLSLLHQTSFYDRYIKSGEYEASGRFTDLSRPYYQLEGKQWGIVGLGNIGRQVARIAQAFGARVVYHSVSGQNITPDYPHLTLAELLATSDVVSLHAPLTPLTENLIDHARLSLMKPSAYLINMARGKIVNESDLCRALNEGRPAGAALDVFDTEPAPVDTPLFTALNEPHRLLCSPHIAWASAEARDKLVGIIASHIRSSFSS